MKRLLELIATAAAQLAARLSSIGGVVKRLVPAPSAVTKRSILIGGIVVAGIGFIALIVVFLPLAFRQRPVAAVPSPYLQRELLIPGFDYLMDDIEDELRRPTLRYYVDPAFPLDPELFRPLLRDRTELAREVVDERIRELLDAALRRTEAWP